MSSKYRLDNVIIENCQQSIIPGFFLGALIDGRWDPTQPMTTSQYKDDGRFHLSIAQNPEESFTAQYSIKDVSMMPCDHLGVEPRITHTTPQIIECLCPEVKKHLPTSQGRFSLFSSAPRMTWVILAANPRNPNRGTYLAFEDDALFSGITTYFEAHNRYPYKTLAYRVLPTRKDVVWTRIDFAISLTFRLTDGMTDVKEIIIPEASYVSPPSFTFMNRWFTHLPLSSEGGAMNLREYIGKYPKQQLEKILGHLNLASTGMGDEDSERIMKLIANYESSRDAAKVKINDRMSGESVLLNLSGQLPVFGYDRKKFVRAIEEHFTKLSHSLSEVYENDRRFVEWLVGCIDNVCHNVSPPSKVKDPNPSHIECKSIFDSFICNGCFHPDVATDYFIEKIEASYNRDGSIQYEFMFGCPPQEESHAPVPVHRQESIQAKEFRFDS